MVPKKEKTVFMIIPPNFHSGTVSVLLIKARNIMEKQAVQWIDWLDKIGSGGTSIKGLGAKPSGDKSFVKQGASQLGVE